MDFTKLAVLGSAMAFGLYLSACGDDSSSGPASDDGKKMIREDSLIFFIRAKATPDKPLVTVEYSPSKKKVLQCYGDGDTKPSDEILHFVNKQWLPFANRQIKRLAA